jgi:hypothetical protein
MELPFAVYTARQGARWISGLTGDRAAIEGFRRTVGKMPEFDMGDPPSCGVINSGDTVIVYRFMCARKTDFRGRDAPYLALTHFPRQLASQIDVEQLLALSPFSTPLTDPPSVISYTGAASAPSAFDPLTLPPPVHLAAPDGFASTGALFAKTFDGTLRLSRTEPTRSASLAVSYERPQPSAPFAPLSAAPSSQLKPPSPGTMVQPARPPLPFFRRHARRVGFAVAAAALLVSMLIGWRLQRSSRSHNAAAKPQPAAAYLVANPDPFDAWAPFMPPLRIRTSPPAQPRPEQCWRPIKGDTP